MNRYRQAKHWIGIRGTSLRTLSVSTFFTLKSGPLRAGRQRSSVEQYFLINDLLCRIRDSARHLVFVVGGQALKIDFMESVQGVPQKYIEAFWDGFIISTL